MPTARAIIRGAHRLIGTIASGENLAAADAQDGLDALNAYLDSASNERLTAYVIERLDVPLLAGKSTYTWGVPGGDIAHPRPFRLDGALLRLLEAPYPTEYPLAVVEQVDYETVAQKTLPSLYPSLVWYEPTYPLGQLHVWTVPAQALTLGLLPWVPLPRFSTLDTAMILPPGYERWLRAGLAVELSMEYGVEPSQTLIAVLAESKSALKRVNTIVPTLGLDAALSSRQAGTWDATTGGYLWRR